MSETLPVRPPAWYWIVAVIGLLFEAFGVWTYLISVGMLPPMEDTNAAAQAIADAAPSWVTAVYAIAVFAGLLGALGLLVRKRWARALLILSLVACLAQFGWWIFLSGALEALGTSTLTVPIFVMVVAALLAWFANHAVKRGWLS